MAVTTSGVPGEDESGPVSEGKLLARSFVMRCRYVCAQGFFSLFQRSSSPTTTTTVSTTAAEGGHALSKLFGILKGGRTSEPSSSAETSRFPFSLMGGSSTPSDHGSSILGWSSAATKGGGMLVTDELLSTNLSASKQSQEGRGGKEEGGEEGKKVAVPLSSLGISMWPSFSSKSDDLLEKVPPSENPGQQQVSFPFSLLKSDAKSSQRREATGGKYNEGSGKGGVSTASDGVEEDNHREKKAGGWWLMSGTEVSSMKDGLRDTFTRKVKDGVQLPGGIELDDAKKSIEAVKEAAEEAGKETTHALLSWWPVLLILVGVGLLVISLLGRRFGQWEGMAGSGDLERGEYAGAPAFRSLDSARKSQGHSRSSTQLMGQSGARGYEDNKEPLISASDAN